MNIYSKIGLGVAGVIATGFVAAIFLAPKINDRQTRGNIELTSLQDDVRVYRDRFSTPYIYADNLADALRGQGFVAAQDRLFQLETVKRAATGRLSEVFGAGENDVVLNLDREARVIGFHHLAERQAELLSPSARALLKNYLEGINGYIETRATTYPLEFKLAGFAPELWTQTDLLAMMYYLGWASAANFDAELIAHRVIQEIGPGAFAEIAPLTINPDDLNPTRRKHASGREAQRWAGRTAPAAHWTNGGWRRQGVGGSNNWAISGEKAGLPAAIVTNDPHLDSRALPGPWHPVGLITPTMRVVGVSAGMPGVVIGRNDHVAFGVTNAYADAVDLYIETIDPENGERYLEGDRSHPFQKIEEFIRVKDETIEAGFREERLIVRRTRRGPVITDHDRALAGDAVISMRWASAEFMGEDLGLDALMTAQNVEDALEAVEKTRIVSLNFVVGDVDGRIARRASGVAPIRLRGDGMAPFRIVDGEDNWGARIPADEMPGEIDPVRGWTGTANHMTAPADYPFVYTTFASPSFRYRRMKELFANERVTSEEVWAAQYDTLNLFARDIAPILALALSNSEDEELREFGDALAKWDFRDNARAIAPTLFQELVRQLARLTFEDELGPEAASAYLSNWYVWQERFSEMVRAGSSPWFDNRETETVENLSMLIERAGYETLDRLKDVYGNNKSNWRWGRVHQMRFIGPLRQSGLAGRLTGNRNYEMSGSGETLLRALYPYDEPFDPKWSASLRMTADLNDSEKIRAVLPGGVVGRTFNRNLADQTAHWMDENAERYWWFSDEAIKANARSQLTLTPSKAASE